MALRSLQMTIRRCLELQLRFLNVMQSRIRQNFNVQWLHCSWHSTLSLLARELQTAYAPAGVLFRDWCRNSSRPSVLTSREMWMAIPKRIKALIQWGSIATVRRNPILLVVWETVRHPDLLVLFLVALLTEVPASKHSNSSRRCDIKIFSRPTRAWRWRNHCAAAGRLKIQEYRPEIVEWCESGETEG